MGYCRYCGAEISYKRTANERWMPCDAITGEPHFCKKDDEKITEKSGLAPCKICGKPTFVQQNGRAKTTFDYSTLLPHKCNKADITRFAKYQQRQLKETMAEKAKKERERKATSKNVTAMKTAKTKSKATATKRTTKTTRLKEKCN